MKWSFLVLQKSCVPDAPTGWTRLVSPVRKEKGKYTCHGCGADGQVRRLEWLTRHLTDDQKQASESLERGDRITTPQGKILADAATLRTDMPDRDTPRYPYI